MCHKVKSLRVNGTNCSKIVLPFAHSQAHRLVQQFGKGLLLLHVLTVGAAGAETKTSGNTTIPNTLSPNVRR